MQEIADSLDCSLHKVKYWMDKHDLVIRSRGDAMYLKYNPKGDPFKFVPPKNLREAKLFGLGLGLYWGEGTKANKHSVRLGNSDPALIEEFINFLVKIFNLKKENLRFSLQLFTDVDEKEALNFWIKKLKINKNQFSKTTITKSGSIGTYKNKSRYGVLTVYYHNKKLRDLLVSMLPTKLPG